MDEQGETRPENQSVFSQVSLWTTGTLLSIYQQTQNGFIRSKTLLLPRFAKAAEIRPAQTFDFTLNRLRLHKLA